MNEIFVLSMILSIILSIFVMWIIYLTNFTVIIKFFLLMALASSIAFCLVNIYKIYTDPSYFQLYSDKPFCSYCIQDWNGSPSSLVQNVPLECQQKFTIEQLKECKFNGDEK